MNRKSPFFSIIIPVRTETAYLQETLKKIKKQTFKSYEILVITDKISLQFKNSSHQTGPSFKRNLGAKIAKGKFLAFLDDDSYPSKNWLKNAIKVFDKNPQAAAICGPCLTPSRDSYRQKASGLVWSSFMGSGGAGTYRNSIQKSRLVDDYPTVNLIVKKTDFKKIGGFNNHFWPGEDTILCLDLTQKLQKQIVYHPSIMVYHHRRAVILPHLQQITRYAIHRGFFAKKFPQTSLRFGYFLPSLFTLYFVSLIPIDLFLLISHHFTTIFFYIFNFPILIYVLLLLLSFFKFISQNSLYVSFWATIAIPVTHLYYGILFIFGLLQSNLNFKPHRINPKTGNYIGG